VTVNPLPTASISYNEDGSAILTGQTGGSYSATPEGLVIDAATGQIDLQASKPNTYTITYKFSDGVCDNSTSVSVTINDNHKIEPTTTTIEYIGGPFCPTGDIDVTRTGKCCGTYSATPVGLVIDESTGKINFAMSIPGTYTVTYTFESGSGSAIATTTVTINSLPTATIIYDEDGEVTITGQEGGTFSSTPAGLVLDGSTGKIDLLTSLPNVYIITYSFSDGVCSNKAITTVKINAGPVIITPTLINYGATAVFCPKEGIASVNRSGDCCGTFTSAPTGLKINRNTGDIDLNTSSPGIFTVVYMFNDEDDNAGVVTTIVTINQLPTAAITYNAQGMVSITGQQGGTFSFAPSGLAINPLTGHIDPPVSTPGSYLVTYDFTDGACNNSISTSVTINEEGELEPTTQISYNGTSFCARGEISVTQIGQCCGSYTATPAGLDVDATSGKINLETSTPGTYTVIYSFLDGGNPATTSTTVVVLPLPTATVVHQSAHLCEGELGEVTIDIEDGTSPYRTIWMVDGETYADEYTTGTQIFDELPAGEYQIRVIDASNCELLLPLNVQIATEANTKLQAENIGEICLGSEFSMDVLSKDELGLDSYSWEYSDDLGANWDILSEEPILQNIAIENRMYRISATSVTACVETSDAFELEIRKPVDDLTLTASKDRIFPGDTVQLIVSTSSHLPIIWSGGVNENNEIRLYKDREVTVTLDDDVCEAVSQGIYLEVLWPTAITPYDQNNINDVFLPNIGCNMIIFNRYGQKVYEGSKGWNGKYRKTFADPGSYYYVVKLPDGDTHKGTVEIVKKK
jgi:hypothetical protein